MNLSWLEVFRDVARSGSFTATGQALGYTQSAVSRQISALEKAVGARLLDRLPRGVRLTEEGRSLLTHAEAVLDRMGAARKDLEALRNLDGGRPPPEPSDPTSSSASYTPVMRQRATSTPLPGTGAPRRRP